MFGRRLDIADEEHAGSEKYLYCKQSPDERVAVHDTEVLPYVQNEGI